MKLVLDGVALPNRVQVDEFSPSDSDLAQNVARAVVTIRDPQSNIAKVPRERMVGMLYDDLGKLVYGGYADDVTRIQPDDLGRAWVVAFRSFDQRAYETQTGSLTFTGTVSDRDAVIAIFRNAMQGVIGSPSGATVDDAIITANEAVGWSGVTSNGLLAGVDYSYMTPRNALELIRKYLPDVYWRFRPDRILRYGRLRDSAPFAFSTSPDRKGLRDYAIELAALAPAGYWRLGELAGAVAADSVGTNPGAYAGGYTLGVAGAVPDGDTGVLFDGTTGQIAVPNSASLNLLGTKLTLCGWVRRAGAAGAFKGIVSKMDAGGTMGYQLRVTNSGTGAIAQVATANGTFSASHAANPFDGPYHFWCAVYDGATLALYIDGVLGDHFAATGAIVSSATRSLRIGVNADQTDFFGGSIDECAVLPVALTADQVATLWRAGAARLMAFENYSEQVLVGDHVNKMRRGGAAASEATAYDEVSIARYGLVSEDPYRNDTTVPAIDVARRAYAELRGRRVRTRRMLSTYDGGIVAGMTVDVIHARLGVDSRLRTDAARSAPRIGSFQSALLMGRSTIGRLAGERGHYLVQKVATVPRGAGVYRYDLELGDNVRDLPTQLAKLSS